MIRMHQKKLQLTCMLQISRRSYTIAGPDLIPKDMKHALENHDLGKKFFKCGNTGTKLQMQYEASGHEICSHASELRHHCWWDSYKFTTSAYWCLISDKICQGDNIMLPCICEPGPIKISAAHKWSPDGPLTPQTVHGNETTSQHVRNNIRLCLSWKPSN